MSELPKITLSDANQFARICIESKWVVKPSYKIPPGSLVQVVDSQGNYCGMAFYNGHSRIALRKLTTEKIVDIEGLIEKKIQTAIALRESQLKLSQISDSYRLINSEGDGLSGLIVDKFHRLLVIEYYSAAMFRLRKKIEECLLKYYPDAALYFFAEKRIQKQESFDCWEREAPPPEVINENGVKFEVHPGTKHKTGFFLDQRENRKKVSELSQGKTVLDLCCHTGGFSIYAMALGKAKGSVGVDYDPDVIALAKKNAELNQVDARFVAADMFDWLKANEMTESFDVVVLDPPRQTKSADEIPLALRRYFKMNTEAMRKLKPGGSLITCSCTGRVTEAQHASSLPHRY
jgi:23S rRNA (cytosine1962-C5)-methyltransferase